MAAIDLRVRQLERARRDHHGVFFLAMGRDDAEIEAAITDARAKLTLQSGDIVVPLQWAGQQVPPSRWIVTSWGQPGIAGALSKAERAALDDAIDRRREYIAQQLAPFRAEMPSGPQESPRGAAQWSDEQLIAAILGKPVT
jgi:hypothetical protein